MRKLLFVVTLLLIALTSVQIWMTKGTTDQTQQMERQTGQGEAQIGGAFTLTDQNGKAVSDSDLRGRVLLVFFGFTHCADICPATVATLSQAMELLGPDADKVTPLFITVDPERDTPAALKDYLAHFDRRIVGLTGSPAQVKAVAEAYKVYFARQGAPWAEESPDEDHDHADHDADHGHTAADYGVDHSGFIYLMGKDGKYVTHFPYDADPQVLADAARKQLGG